MFQFLLDYRISYEIGVFAFSALIVALFLVYGLAVSDLRAISFLSGNSF